MKQLVTKRFLLAVLLVMGGLLLGANSAQAQAAQGNYSMVQFHSLSYKASGPAVTALNTAISQAQSELGDYSPGSHQYLVVQLKADAFTEMRNQIQGGQSVKQSILLGMNKLGQDAQLDSVSSLLTDQEASSIFNASVTLLKN